MLERFHFNHEEDNVRQGKIELNSLRTEINMEV